MWYKCQWPTFRRDLYSTYGVFLHLLASGYKSQPLYSPYMVKIEQQPYYHHYPSLSSPLLSDMVLWLSGTGADCCQSFQLLRCFFLVLTQLAQAARETKETLQYLWFGGILSSLPSEWESFLHYKYQHCIDEKTHLSISWTVVLKPWAKGDVTGATTRCSVNGSSTGILKQAATTNNAASLVCQVQKAKRQLKSA